MSGNSIVAFLAGVALGAVAALLMAPKSGTELRAELAREAQADRVRFQQEYHKTVSEVHDRLDQVQKDVQSTLNHLKEQGQTAVAAK